MTVRTLSVFFIFVTLLGFPSGRYGKKKDVLKFLHRGREAYDKLKVSIEGGALMGLAECGTRFRYHKWNCTILFDNKRKGLAKMLSRIPPLSTRETAFTHSISAAGVTYALTKDCRMGKFEDCSCVHGKNHENKGNWWGGCNENVKFGEVMSKHFMEALEIGKDKITLMNVHNSEVGRKAVRANLKRECRCHGITGSCSTRTCWRKLSSFAEVGLYLKEKYENAKRVHFKNGKFYEITLLSTNALAKKDHSLIYSKFSPDYCLRNMTVGSPGVLGRQCDGNKAILAQCKELCSSCGLRAEEFSEDQSTYCNCKFEWCCKVNCLVCKQHVKKTRCVYKKYA